MKGHVGSIASTIETLRDDSPFDRQEGMWPGRSDLRVGWTLVDRRHPDREAPETAIRLALEYHRTPAYVHQIHGDQIWVIDPESTIDPRAPKLADGILTVRRDILMGVTIADCAPLFLRGDHVVGVLHAGWRGVIGGILPAALDLMSSRFGVDRSRVEVLLGPCIAACCFEVSSSVAMLFPASVRRSHGSSCFVDLAGAILDQWLRHGGRIENFHREDRCSVCQRPLMHSHRRTQGAGRNLAYVYFVN